MAAEFYRVILILQVVFYMMALLGAGLASRGSVPRLLSAPYTFLMMNAAATVALFKLVAGTQTHLWEKPRV
jgi:biofilm PGA synthesis N-glycosyltransferase PgaC